MKILKAPTMSKTFEIFTNIEQIYSLKKQLELINSSDGLGKYLTLKINKIIRKIIAKTSLIFESELFTNEAFHCDKKMLVESRDSFDSNHTIENLRIKFERFSKRYPKNIKEFIEETLLKYKTALAIDYHGDINEKSLIPREFTFYSYAYLRELYHFFKNYLEFNFCRKTRSKKTALESTVFRDNVFCLICNTQISKKTLEYHLKGKKHINKRNDNKHSQILMPVKGSGEFIEVNEKKFVKYASSVKKSVKFLRKNLKNYCKNTSLPKPSKISCFSCNLEFNSIRKYEKHFIEEAHQSTLPRIEQITSSFSEEFEDEEGNIYNKATYEDLKNNGLL